jgi:hypothetical protein
VSQAIYFFSTRADLVSVLQLAESKRSLKYALAGMFLEPDIRYFCSGIQIEGLGSAKKGDQIHENKYLVIDSNEEIAVREVPQRRGGIKYAIDQQINPASIAFVPGGIFQENFVIQGELSTCTDDPVSKELLRLFATEIQRQFVKIQEFYVGKEAAALLDRGYRLTQSVHAPLEYDLARS